jgi:hypothetical protein
MRAKRNRTKNTVPFGERLEKAADDAREAAEKLPHGQEREALLKKARQAEMAVHLNALLVSPGAQSSR